MVEAPQKLEETPAVVETPKAVAVVETPKAPPVPRLSAPKLDEVLELISLLKAIQSDSMNDAQKLRAATLVVMDWAALAGNSDPDEDDVRTVESFNASGLPKTMMPKKVLDSYMRIKRKSAEGGVDTAPTQHLNGPDELDYLLTGALVKRFIDSNGAFDSNSFVRREAEALRRVVKAKAVERSIKTAEKGKVHLVQGSIPERRHDGTDTIVTWALDGKPRVRPSTRGPKNPAARPYVEPEGQK